MSTSKESVPPSEKNEKKNDLDTEKVHSANKWEAVDLGDDDRKKKFLKLMGAAKQEHHGRFVIGDKEPSKAHTRNKQETEEINQQLEDQYKHTFEHRVTRWSHKGLGFDDDKEGESNDKKTDTDKPAAPESEKTENKQASADGVTGESKKRENTEPVPTSESPPKKPKMMMNFVKSTD